MSGPIGVSGQLTPEQIAEIRAGSGVVHASDAEIDALVKTGAQHPELATSSAPTVALTVVRKRTPLRELVLNLSPDRLLMPPPPRQYLLKTEDDEGVLVRGKVGLFAAPGGTGKSWALTQLAVAIATGERWFGEGGWQAAAGRTLLLLAEEDAEEAERRLHWAIKVADADAEIIARNVTLCPLAGHGVALTAEGELWDGALPETAFAEEVREILREAQQAGDPYSLVVVDPLARFAGAEAEKDSAAATRFVQVLETFTTPVCGSPFVMAAHHTRKVKDKDEDREVADIIRGSSALVDGVRWAAVFGELRQPSDDAPILLRLRVPKTNYTARPPPLHLTRLEDGHGALRVATAEEMERHEAGRPGARTESSNGSADALKARLLELLSASPDSGKGLASRTRVRKDFVLKLLRELEADGSIVRVGHRWQIGSGFRTVPNGSRELALVSVPGSPPPLGVGTGNREPVDADAS